MTFYVGHNMPGYLPEGDVHECEDFEEAKAVLVHDLKFNEDYADTEDAAFRFMEAYQDVNHWSGQDSILVGNTVYWINEEN